MPAHEGAPDVLVESANLREPARALLEPVKQEPVSVDMPPSVQAQLALAAGVPAEPAAAPESSLVQPPSAEVSHEAPISQETPVATRTAKPVASSKPRGRPRKVVEAVQPPAPAPAPAQQPVQDPVAPAAPVSGQLKLFAVRLANLTLVTSQAGAKSKLAELSGMSPANISHRLHDKKKLDDADAQRFCEALKLPEGWFDTPHSEDQVPAHVRTMLGGARPNSNRGGRPAKAGEKAATEPPRKRGRPKGSTNKSTAGATAAPAELAMPQTEAAPLSLRSAVLSSTREPAMVGAASSEAPAPSQVAPATAAAPTAPAAVASRAPTPRAASAKQPDSVVDEVLAEDGALGDLAVLLIRTVAAKSRQGRLSNKMLMDVLTQMMAL